MSARTTIEAVTVTMLRWQVDRLGYILCGEHTNPERGGETHTLEARDAIRSAECDDVGLWTCDRCHRYILDWPTHVETVHVLVEHTAARIF